MSNEQNLAPASQWAGKIYNGEWCDGGAGSIDVIEKATGERLGSVGVASVEDVAKSAKAAKAAQKEWAQLAGPERGDIVRRFSELAIEHCDEIAEWIIRESASIQPKGPWEVNGTAREALESAATQSEPQGLLLATADPAGRSVARRVPLGVVGIITPWNSPFLLAARVMAPALATGNAVIVKPDLQTPVSGGVLLAYLLEKAGVPKGLVHILPGGADIGQAIVSDPNVDMISFTGSTRAGRLVGEAAGRGLKRVALELGGNNPLIVCDDVDIESATSVGAFGSFFHQGQICLTVGRHIVHEKIAGAYIEALKTRAGRLPVGDPFREEVALGPMINESQCANVDRLISESVAMGAKIEVGGDRKGLFYQPTVMSNVTPDMPIFSEEIFGPVAPVITYKTDEEAIALANNTEYGLAAALLCKDLARAHSIADQLEAGGVHINDHTVLHDACAPIGGCGISGNGTAPGKVTNIDQYTEWQWVTSRAAPPPYPF